MTIPIDDPAGALAGGATLLLLVGAALWRLGIEFERAWLAAEAARPEAFKDEPSERTRREAGLTPPAPELATGHSEDARELAVA